MVMYTNRRVKKRDLLNIANYKLICKGKKRLKVRQRSTIAVNRDVYGPFKQRSTKERAFSAVRNYQRQRTLITKTPTINELM